MAGEGDSPDKPLYVSAVAGSDPDDDKLEQLRSLLEQIEANTDGLELKADTVNLQTDELEAKLTQLIAAVGLVDGHVDGIEALLATANSNQATEATLQDVENRLQTVEGYLDGVETLLNTIEQDVAQQTTLASVLTALQAALHVKLGPAFEVSGRTSVQKWLDHVTVGSTIFTPTAGKKFYLEGGYIVGFNTSAVTVLNVAIDDGATPTTRLPFSLPAVSNQMFVVPFNFSGDPVEFATDVRFVIVSGTCRLSVFLRGYEK